MKKKLCAIMMAISIMLSFGLTGCFGSKVSVVGIEQSIVDGETIYTVKYSDGTTSTLNVPNGKDGLNGATGQNGKDGQDVSLEDVFQKWLDENPGESYDTFLHEYLSYSDSGNIATIHSALLSSAKVYTEFTEKKQTGFYQTTVDTSVYLGSSVIYKKDSDYTYFMTNYHVIYSASSYEKTPKRVVCYLYGSEGEPVKDGTDESGYTKYNYGGYGIECEYYGGSATTDIAIVRAKTVDVDAINPNVKPITFAQRYYVGETAIAIGNPEGEGISVTEGIVSVDNEMISLNVDGTSRQYRSIRIDTAIYNGSSGGGLFNSEGHLIGITNSGDGNDQNVNYAVPLEIVESVADNIMYHASNGVKTAMKIKLGITVDSHNSKYVYSTQNGYGRIVEDVTISEVSENSIAMQMGLQNGDIIRSISINEKEYPIERYFSIGDLLLRVRTGHTLIVTYERNGETKKSTEYVVVSSDVNVTA